MLNLRIVAFISLMFFICQVACSKENIITKPAQKSSSIAGASHLLNAIADCNNNYPRTFSSNFTVDVKIKKKRFKSLGKVVFNNQPKGMKINFFDAIFKSIITTILLENEKLKLYFPVEKILYIDNINAIELKNYTNIDMNINIKLLSDLTIGIIPVIENYSVKDVIKQENNTSDTERRFLVLENNKFFQTLSFKGHDLDKMLWINKRTKEKLEIYVERFINKEKINFYKKITLNIINKNCRLIFKFKNIKFNIPVDFKEITNIDLPKEVRVIELNRTYNRT